MRFWNRFLRRKPPSRLVAKERLQLVIVHDRAGLSPEMMNTLRDELVAVLSKYIDIDTVAMEFELTQNRSQSRLIANIPLRPNTRPNPSQTQPQDSPA